MQIEPDLLSDHLKAAAVEQTARSLSREGSRFEKEARLEDDVTADLRAVLPDGKERFYHFVLAGMGTEQPGRASQVRAAAAARGAEYRLVLVRPPRDVNVEIVGIEEALRQALTIDPPENLRRLATDWEVADIADIDIARARLIRGESHVAGDGLVLIRFLLDAEKPIELDAYPFKFDVALDPQGALKSVTKLEVDTSS